MTLLEVITELKRLKLPVTHEMWQEGEAPDLPYLIYRVPGSNNFGADGKAYFKVNELDVELYSEKRDFELEGKLESVLDNIGFYEKTSEYLKSEKMQETLYEMEV